MESGWRKDRHYNTMHRNMKSHEDSHESQEKSHESQEDSHESQEESHESQADSQESQTRSLESQAHIVLCRITEIQASGRAHHDGWTGSIGKLIVFGNLHFCQSFDHAVTTDSFSIQKLPLESRGSLKMISMHIAKE